MGDEHSAGLVIDLSDKAAWVTFRPCPACLFSPNLHCDQCLGKGYTRLDGTPLVPVRNAQRARG